MKTNLTCCLFLILAIVSPVTAAADDTGTLIDAASRGDINRVRSLLAGGADVNTQRTDGVTALWMAAGAGHTEIVEALLERGADVNVKDKTYGATALYMAAQEGHTNVVKVLLESKANVNIKREINGVTALMMAAQKGHTEIVKLLLAAGADVNAKANDGRAPLSIAKMMRHTEIIKLLKEYSTKDKEQKSLSHSGQSQFQSRPSNIQIDIQKEITRLHSDDPVEKEDAAFKLSCQPERARSAIPHLIDLLDDETPVAVRSQGPFSFMADQYMVLKGTVRLAADLALRRITGKKIGGRAGWRQWWKEHEKELETAKIEEIRASHILIATAKLDEKGKANAKARIEELLRKIRAGASFEELAKAHSNCPSKVNGGDLGYFKRGKMVKEFDDAAFALRVGEVSDVIETSFGYHLIKLTDRKPQILQGSGSPSVPVVQDRTRYDVVERLEMFTEAIPYYNRGKELYEKGDLDGAIYQYNQAIEIYPLHAEAYSDLAIVLRAKGNLEGCIQHLKKALEINPRDAIAYYNLGNALLSKGDLDGAASEKERQYENPIGKTPSGAKSNCQTNPDTSYSVFACWM